MAVRGLYTVFSPADLYRYEVVVCALTAVVTVGLALGVAQLSYTFIERPFIELGRRAGAKLGGLKHPIGLPPATQPAE
jgi:peptidoglycan/LPS O-acetylase OafA/YrhL